jgi:hypothetical protein
MSGYAIPGVPPGNWPHTVIVCGGRAYADRANVYRVLDGVATAHKVGRVVTGGATGADALARDWCHWRRVECHIEPANWRAHGRAAGPIRNQRMLDDWQPSVVIAFPGGTGTGDMVARATAAGVPILRVEG